MNISPQRKLRLAFLARMVRKEIHHLQLTDQRLFDVLLPGMPVISFNT